MEDIENQKESDAIPEGTVGRIVGKIEGTKGPGEGKPAGLTNQSEQQVVIESSQPAPRPVEERVRVIYVTERLPYSSPYSRYSRQNDQADAVEAMTFCALCGCMFSWIPIVGWFTYAINACAPSHSPRAALAYTACAIATLVAFFNIIFFALYHV